MTYKPTPSTPLAPAGTPIPPRPVGAAAPGSLPKAQPAPACDCGGAARLLVVPGLRDSGPAHWQTWLERQHRGAVRVVQHRWDEPDLAQWASRIASTLAAQPSGPWVVVAHSFGVLALAAYLAAHPQSPIRAGLLVAPADPAKFGVEQHLPQQALPCPTTLVASSNDPWMSLRGAQYWAGRWDSALVNLGPAGHVNADAGFGPFPFSRQWVLAAQQRQVSARRQRAPQAVASQAA